MNKFSNRLLMVLCVLLSLAPVGAFASEYAVDGAHSSVAFTIRHFVSKVTGGFKDFDGSFNFDDKSPETHH